MLIWSGAGVVIPLVGMFTFLGLMLVLPGPEKSEFWVFGAIAMSMAVAGLPLGLLLNTKSKVAARDGQQHHFMFIPMQYFGVLALIIGLGLFGAQLFTGSSGSTSASEASPCAEAIEGLGRCFPAGAAGMMQMGCEASDPAIQNACAACVRSAGDPCASCQQACSFQPSGSPPGM